MQLEFGVPKPPLSAAHAAESLLFKGTCAQAGNQLVTPGGAKSFPRGGRNFFELCPIF